jgi:thiol-disulfide isomerase/thioredoxin
MLNRRHLVVSFTGALVLGAALTLSPLASAAPKTFDQKAFEAAQNAGKPILLHVHAPWCPTCRAQEPILTKIEGTPKFKDLVVLRIDYDSRKDVLRGFRVNQQSTLIVFKGKQEVGRSTGDTNAGSIEALVAKAI